MEGAVLVPCCSSSFCHECINISTSTLIGIANHLMGVEDGPQFICRICQQDNVRPDDLIVDEILRSKVDYFVSEIIKGTSQLNF